MLQVPGSKPAPGIIWLLDMIDDTGPGSNPAPGIIRLLDMNDVTGPGFETRPGYYLVIGHDR